MEDEKRGEPMNASVGLDWTTRTPVGQAVWLALPVVLSALIFFLGLPSRTSRSVGAVPTTISDPNPAPSACAFPSASLARRTSASIALAASIESEV